MPAVARRLAQILLERAGQHVTVDPYAWNDARDRAPGRAPASSRSRGTPPDADHTAEWVLMRFEG